MHVETRYGVATSEDVPSSQISERWNVFDSCRPHRIKPRAEPNKASRAGRDPVDLWLVPAGVPD